MPLPMIHLGVAVKLNISVNKSPEFYLGNISPDAVHVRNGFVHEDKIRSHCNTRNIDAIDELASLCGMIGASAGAKREFLLGYLVHILTDIFWNNSVYSQFKERFEADPEPVQDRRMAYYNDTDQLDFEFYNQLDWRESVWSMLKMAQGYAVDGAVSGEEVAMWRDRTVEWYSCGRSQHTNPVKYMTYDELDAFTDYAAEKCDNYIKEKNLL